MGYADPTLIENQVIDIVNAAAGIWGGTIVDARRDATAISKARVASGFEVLRAIAANQKGGYWGAYAALVTVANDAFLPAHDGEPGIPVIVPFSGAPAVEGVAAAPSEIDSYRSSAVNVYAGESDGAPVAHNAADAAGMASPVAGLYSLVAKRFKFTGFSAQVPLIQLTRTMADVQVPDVFEPTLVKLTVPKLVKEGDNLAMIAGAYGALGMQDLVLIRTGAAEVPPVPDVFALQRGELK